MSAPKPPQSREPTPPAPEAAPEVIPPPAGRDAQGRAVIARDELGRVTSSAAARELRRQAGMDAEARTYAAALRRGAPPAQVCAALQYCYEQAMGRAPPLLQPRWMAIYLGSVLTKEVVAEMHAGGGMGGGSVDLSRVTPEELEVVRRIYAKALGPGGEGGEGK